MRAWLTTDSHIGVKNGSPEWIEIQRDYYYNLFIPTVKKHFKKGDILIHCGDVYDNRSSLNIQAMNFAIQLFEDLAQIFEEVFVICGNHDIFKKHSNDINSLKTIMHIPGVNIIEEHVETFHSGDNKICLMPWNSTIDKEKEVLSDIGSSDYLFAHTSVSGALYSGSIRVDKEHGNDPSTFANYGKVYTGHIHTSQVIKNVRFLGSPYELTRNDKKNPKSFWLVDFDSGEEKQFLNKYSPMYIDVDYETLKSMDSEKYDNFLGNNWVDLIIDVKHKNTKEFDDVLDKVYEANDRILEVYEDPEAEKEDTVEVLPKVGERGILTVKDYIDAQVDYKIKNTKVKKTMNKFLDGLYKKHLD